MLWLVYIIGSLVILKICRSGKWPVQFYSCSSFPRCRYTQQLPQ
ncbi:hypothetical protein EIZ48_16745 [Photobacterium alginatilyticum]|uniref:Uncharacterized protein n=1 Tax=Photobacterium alginatilyticum TaxID=1775171 RepID=A0ABW9YKX5_9GAMM|nr:hypothetical protein [Photobacterium alginatilyticum]